MIARLAPLALAFALGCNGSSSDDPDTPALGAVIDRIEPGDGACETFTTSEGLTCVDIEGAERFFGAEITLNDDGTINGRFYVILFANEAFKETADWANGPGNADSCAVAMPLSGTHSEGGGDCGACDTTITYSISAIDNSLTNCPAGYGDDIRTVLPISDAFWGLVRSSNGNAQGWDTQRSWAPNGVHEGNEVLLWSDGACEWYGTGVCS